MKTKYKASCAVAAILSGFAGAAVAADASSAAGSNTSVSAVEEVIVTAQHRDESIQKVPLTVQALSGDTLQKQNITTLDDLLKYTPNVTFASNGPGTGNIFIRGLSAGFAGNQSSATKDPFPNVAIYLDEESMSFPSRNVDIYLADMSRVEVLEGPQGTLFGGGAEAGAVRYITNKPNLDHFEGSVEAGYGWTAHGDANTELQAVVNIPIIEDKLAIRAVIYDERQGGYIDNVPSQFDRSNNDLGNYYFNIKPGATGLCPNGQAAGAAGLCALPSSAAPSANNQAVAAKAQNPATYTGGRLSVLWQVNPDWDVLITETLQHLDAEGMWAQEPVGLNFQPLGPLQETSFAPAYDKDNWSNTAWTVNGKAGPLKLIYTGGYLDRHISQQQDYTGYSRSGGGMYYECTGGSTGWGTAPPQCYSPVAYWNDQVHSTHITQEFRVSSPDTWRLRFIAGGFWEQFRIYDVMNFDYKTIPSCDPENLTEALAGGPVCVSNVVPSPGATTIDPSIRGDATAFGEDATRGYQQTAAFVSFDFDVIPDVLTISGGTRYYQYNEFEVGSVYQTGTSCLNIPNGCFADNVNIDSHDDHVTYSGFKSRANISWKITPDILSYFTFSQGYRPGGFNRKDDKGVATGADGNPQYLTPNAYAPDTLTNYEIGLKTQLFDHRLLLNLSAYYMDWDNVQLLLFNPTVLGNVTFGVNGPDYNIKGLEAQFTGRVTEGLTLTGSASYNHSTQSNSPCLVSNNPASVTYGNCITEAVVKGEGLQPFENPFGAPGTVPAFSPAFQGNIRARYEWNIGDYKAYASVGGNYVGSMWNQPATYASGEGVLIPTTTLLRYLQPAYGTIDASIGIAKDKWFAEIYGTNLNNSNASTFTSSAQFIKSEVPLRPRVVMLKVGANF
jgi:outer membrane receptor protein involved in Fe transport